MGVSWAGIKRRFLRAMITLVGVILAIAFVSHMLVVDSITQTLVGLKVTELNVAGVHINSSQGTDSMTLLLRYPQMSRRA